MTYASPHRRAAVRFAADPAIKRDLRRRWDRLSQTSRLRGEVAYYSNRGFWQLMKAGGAWHQGHVSEAEGWAMAYRYVTGPKLHCALSDLHKAEIDGAAGLDAMAAGFLNGMPC